MYYCTLRDLILYLHKDDSGFRKSQISDNIHNAIHIHHGLATKAVDYTKKEHVFRLVTADQAEYLFQTRYILKIYKNIWLSSLTKLQIYIYGFCFVLNM